MQTALQGRLEQLLAAYSHHYTVEREVQVEGGRFPAAAEFYLRDENRLLTRGHVFSAFEQHEYVYFFVTGQLDAATLRAQVALSQRAGLARVRPHREHMCSFVTLVILADTITPDAAALLRHTRLHKNYRFRLHGWMEYRIAAMDASQGRFYANPAGRDVRRTLEANFGSRKHASKGEKLYEWFHSLGR